MGPTEGAGRGEMCGLWIGGAFTLSMSCFSHGSSPNSPPPSEKKQIFSHMHRGERKRRDRKRMARANALKC